jgi:hypothetical protein
MTACSMMAWTCYWLGDGAHETIKPTFGRWFDWPHRLYQWLPPIGKATATGRGGRGYL